MKISTLKGYRYLILTATIVTFVVMVMGNVVRVTGSGLACPDWPTCYGQWSLPLEMAARLNVIHRWLSAVSGLLVGVVLLFTLIRFRAQRWLSRAVVTAFVLIMIQGGLGASVVFSSDPSLLAPFHLCLAMLALGLLTAATTATFFLKADADLPGGLKFNLFGTPFRRLTAVTLAALFVLMLSGALVTSSGTSGACAGWPLCAGGLPMNAAGWIEMSHRVMTLIVSLMVIALFISAWRSQRSQLVVLPAVNGTFMLLLAQVMLGALKVARGFPSDLVGLHAASSAGLWVVQIVGLVAAGISNRTVEEERAEASQPLQLKQRARDFFMLSKPIIVLLLLVTTYAGMVVGGRSIPSLRLTLWTILGGALAAAGSSAINQYIDRDLDKNMQRTAQRPLPAGRLTPAEGLAYGLGACLVSFFIMAGFVNLLAALLSLAGMIYYVLIYSIWLKKLTVQNIVIGGGAGAIPPLVGWAAASGSLNIPSLFLFALIFLWTPPHFWALALVRRNDYARAGVPMLPVVRGEHNTRIQIFVYTLELVALTLLMPVLKITGSIFLVSAVVLGVWLIWAAWRVLRSDGNKTAWMMYRYTSMYLALIFLAMVLDVLI